jgi:hypothetical protein
MRACLRLTERCKRTMSASHRPIVIAGLSIENCGGGTHPD